MKETVFVMGSSVLMIYLNASWRVLIHVLFSVCQNYIQCFKLHVTALSSWGGRKWSNTPERQRSNKATAHAAQRNTCKQTRRKMHGLGLACERLNINTEEHWSHWLPLHLPHCNICSASSAEEVSWALGFI